MLKFDNVTFCVKTIHRPWACHRLVRSLLKHFDAPLIVVVDDGLPKYRFSQRYPRTAKLCRVIDFDQYDVGVGAGRNIAIDEAKTEFIFLLDDDHVVTEDMHLDRLYQRFHEHNLDILAVRQGKGGLPMMLTPLQNGKRLWMHRGERKRVGNVCWCDMVSNAFLAKRETIANLRWDESLKTYEHWEFFYRASHLHKLQIAVATDCSVIHAHVVTKTYSDLRHRPRFRTQGLRKHGFHSLRYPGGSIVFS